MHHVLEFFKADDTITVQINFTDEIVEGLICEGVALVLEHGANLVIIDFAIAVIIEEIVRNLQPLTTQDLTFIHGGAAPLFKLYGTIVIKVYLLKNAIGLGLRVAIVHAEPPQSLDDLLLAQFTVQILVNSLEDLLHLGLLLLRQHVR